MAENRARPSKPSEQIKSRAIVLSWSLLVSDLCPTTNLQSVSRVTTTSCAVFLVKDTSAGLVRENLDVPGVQYRFPWYHRAVRRHSL